MNCNELIVMIGLAGPAIYLLIYYNLHKMEARKLVLSSAAQPHTLLKLYLPLQPHTLLPPVMPDTAIDL